VPHELRGPASEQRWIDNYAYRSGGGRISARAFRFGGEGYGLGAVWNFSPFACELVQSPYSHLNLCSRVPHNATLPLPPSVDVIPGSAVSIVDSQVDTHQAVITLVEVPNAISVRDNELRAGVASPLFALGPDTNLSSPALTATFELASRSWGRNLPLVRCH